MIITTPRIDRYIAPIRLADIIHRVMIRAIIHRQHNRTHSIRPHGARLAAPRRGIGKPAHITGKTLRNKLPQMGASGLRQGRSGHMHRVEPVCHRGIIEPVTQP